MKRLTAECGLRREAGKVEGDEAGPIDKKESPAPAWHRGLLADSFGQRVIDRKA
ncbi:hypothetical protein PaecuDRAFT_3687 [Paenibacillus curdlanolyticus YK9]|uniref:Uncharacterized protein n=1 Tax=Paenibacillus curdlanolyticus YK9 TaxID=717606 RepID=E0IDI3_9BACL|nr:hypothetical protein PaecuDRAFT_3687 [Paenibacillus curdlanolyticus YK9]